MERQPKYILSSYMLEKKGNRAEEVVTEVNFFKYILYMWLCKHKNIWCKHESNLNLKIGTHTMKAKRNIWTHDTLITLTIQRLQNTLTTHSCGGNSKDQKRKKKWRQNKA